MQYWIDGSGNYYEGDQVNITDTEVTKRPFYTCTWNYGLSIWEYDLPATRIAAKNIWVRECSTDLDNAARAGSDPYTMTFGFIFVALFADAVSYTDNAANNTPFYDGYLAVSGLANKAAVHAAIKNDYDILGVVFGKIAAAKDAAYAAIDAALTGPNILAVTYSRPW